MNWDDVKNKKEDSIRESTKNPRPFEKDGKTYEKFSDYLESEEYEEYLKTQIVALKEYQQKAKEYFESLDMDNQLLLFFHITHTIYQNYFEDKSSYRGLLYDKFEFGPESYSLGMDSGMFAVHNAISTPEDREEMLRLIVKNFNLELDRQQLYALRYILHNICLPNSKLKDMLSGQQAFEFEKST
jgi:hypothetical protein